MKRGISISLTGLFIIVGLAACGAAPPRPAAHRLLRERAAGRPAGLSALNLGTAARVLGLSRGELASRLRAGDSLDRVAASRHVPVRRLEAALLAAKRRQLDALVRNHRLDELSEARIFRRFQAELPNLMAKPRPAPPDSPGVGSPGAPA